jgi:threonine dehydratase
MQAMIGIQDIERAAVRLQGQLLATPCVESRTLSDIVGAQVFLKFENLQFTASFKERGACNKLVDLSESGVRGWWPCPPATTPRAWRTTRSGWA